MRAAILPACVLVLCAVTGEARAEEASLFSRLPVGRFSVPPTKPVAYVAGRQKVPDLFVLLQPLPGNRVAEPVRVVTERRTERSVATSTCITEGPTGRLAAAAGDDPRAGEWPESLANEVYVSPRSAGNPNGGVTAVHTERVVEVNGGAELEIVDAWVDPRTRGARLIAKSSLPLALVHSPGFGVKVYAARDERGEGRRFVHFVVVRPIFETNDATSQLFATRLDGDVIHSNGCGHHRVAVSLGPEDGDAATIATTVRLPDRGAPGVGEMRVRTLRVQVSVSQTASEKEPLVSVSSGWSGREQIERVGTDEGD